MSGATSPTPPAPVSNAGRPRNYTQKELRFTFDLPAADPQGPTQAGPPISGASDPNRVTISGLRASAVITQGGQVDKGGADITIYGLTLSNMNRLSTLGQQIAWQRRNIVTVEAGDANGMGVVYQGPIINGWSDFAAMPNNSFRITSEPAAYARVQPIPPTTISGFADVATLLAGLAQQANYHFENSGVQVQLYCPYFPGTAQDQIDQCVAHAGINHTIDSATNTLAIWPQGAARGSQIPIIAPDSGMIGYPTFTSDGVDFTTIFNPSIRFGQRVSIQRSALTPANKLWDIARMVHELDCRTPNGHWHTRFSAFLPGILHI